jgi:hypothetical protein
MTETDKQDVTLSPKARELLTELADFLDRLPEERFDYTRWVGRDWRGSPDLSCGTTACAIGWATTLPSWRAAGLALQPSRLSGGLAVPVHQPTGRTGLKGIAAILGIPVDNAEFCFYQTRIWRIGCRQIPIRMQQP